MGRRRVTAAQADDPGSGLTVEVVDADGVPVAGVNVQALVGDWRRAEAQDSDVDNESTVAYSQRATFLAGSQATLGDSEPGVMTDESGLAEFASPETWTVRGADDDYEDGRESYLPPPINPTEGNPQVTLIGTYTDANGTEWFGSQRVLLERLRRDTVTLRLVYKRLLGPQPLRDDRFAGGAVQGPSFSNNPLADRDDYQNDVYGAVAAWHAVPVDGSYRPSTEHRLFVEVHSARKPLELVDTDPEGLFTDGNPAPKFPTIDAVGPASTVNHETGADPDESLGASRESRSFARDHASMLEAGTLSIEVSENVEVTTPDDRSDVRVPTIRAPLTTNVENEGMYAFALATAFRLGAIAYDNVNEDSILADSGAPFPVPLYPHLQGAFKEGYSTGSADDRALPQTIQQVLIGTAGQVIDQVGDDAAGEIPTPSSIASEALTAVDVALSIGNVVLEATDSSTEPSLGGFTNTVTDDGSLVSPAPNTRDSWQTQWQFTPDEDTAPAGFAAVHRVPVRLDEPAEVTVRGVWRNDVPGKAEFNRDLVSVQREITPRETPVRGGD